MSEEKEYELEIDLIEWMKEIKNHMAVIVVAALLFAAAAGLYMYKCPVFSYTFFINCSKDIGERERLSFASLFRNDIDITEQNSSGAQASLQSVEMVNSGTQSKDIKDRFTNLMKFEFNGNDPDFVKEYGSKYVNEALEQINTSIVENYEANFSKQYLNTVNAELNRLNNYIANASANQDIDAVKATTDQLSLFKERLETKEINKAVIKAAVVESQNKEAQRVVNKSVILKSAALGFFLSFAYVSCKYFAKAVSRK